MKRRQLFTTLVGAGSVAALSSQSVQAQDSNEDLTNRVAELEEQMAAVLERLTVLEGGADSGDLEVAPSGDAVVVSGDGQMVSDDFALAGGRYKVTATCTFVAQDIGIDTFFVTIFGDNGQEDSLFIETFESDFEGSVVFESDSDGTFYVEVETRGSWELTFEPRS